MAVSSSRQVLNSAAALLEYGCKGAGVLTDGGAGAAGHSQAGFGKLDAQAVRLAASSSGSSRVALGLLGSFMQCLVFLRLQALGFVGGSGAGIGHGLGLFGVDLRDLPAQAPVLHLPGARGSDGGSGQRGGDVGVQHHASAWMPTCAPASVMVMTRLTGRSGTRVDTCTHCLPLTPSRMSWPMPSTLTSGAKALATW